MKKFTSLIVLLISLHGIICFAQYGDDQKEFEKLSENKADSISISRFQQNIDVGVEEIINPSSFAFISDLQNVTIKVKNYGTTTLYDIPVSYDVDSGDMITEFIKGPMFGGETFDFTFTGFFYPENFSKQYGFHVCTNFEGDEYPANDCKTKYIYYWAEPIYCDCNAIIEDEFIANVAFGSINNTSGWQGDVADYTALSTRVFPGDSLDITVTNGNPWALDHVTFWADWNLDGNFDYGFEYEEYVLTNVGSTGEIFTGIIRVPEGQSRGAYRVRIRMTYSSIPFSCGSASYGEVEDYMIIVEEPTLQEIQVTPAGLVENLMPNQSENQTIILSNTGDNQLSYWISLSGDEKNDEKLTSDENQKHFSGVPENSFSLEKFPDGSFGKPANIAGAKSSREILRYDNGINSGSFGNNTGSSYEVAAYFPAEIMEQYAGWEFMKMVFYLKEYPLALSIRIYGQGTETSPGPVIYSKAINGFHMGWNEVSPSVVQYLNGEDIWISYCVVHHSGTVPCGYDEGPAVAGFGDWMHINGVWTTNADFGLDNNWNLYFSVYDPLSIYPDNDIGVKLILSPVTATNILDAIVSTHITNYGINPQSNFPISYMIDGNSKITEIFPDTIEKWHTVAYSFSNAAQFEKMGHTYELKVFTELPGDEKGENDSKIRWVTNHYSEYLAALTTTPDEYISNVLFGSINNPTGWQDSIADFTTLSTTIEAGTSESIIVTNGVAYANDLVTAWVDWNKDFDFNAADEQYVLTNQNGAGETFTGEISVPQNQPTGNYRLRIRMCYYTEPVPCGGSTYGEVEEYSIYVVNNQTITWLAVEPMTGVVNPNDSTTVNVTFDASGLQTGTYEGFIIISSNDPCDPFTTIPVTLIVGQCPLPPPLNIEGYEILPNVAYLTWQVPEPSGNLLGYNIYRNNQKINPDIVSNLFYVDSLTNPSQYFYHITAVYPECEASSDTISLFITNLLEKENDGITIFPNPATNFVNIKSQNSISQISIINSFGQVVFSGDFECNDVQINTSGFNKGIYFIRIETEMGVVSEKLVIQ